jgi:excisionase family DNA binding protein
MSTTHGTMPNRMNDENELVDGHNADGSSTPAVRATGAARVTGVTTETRTTPTPTDGAEGDVAPRRQRRTARGTTTGGATGRMSDRACGATMRDDQPPEPRSDAGRDGPTKRSRAEYSPVTTLYTASMAPDANVATALERIGEKIDTLLDVLSQQARAMARQARAMSIQANAIRLRKKVLTFAEACAYLDLSESHLYKLTADGTVPHSKPNGKKLYFRREELDAWVMSNPVKTRADIEREAATYCMQHERNTRRRNA